MDKNIKRQHSPTFKVQVVMEVLKEIKTLSQLSSEFSIHTTQIRKWKDHALEVLKTSFEGERVGHKNDEQEKLIEELYKQVGQQKVELDWLKKKTGYTTQR